MKSPYSLSIIGICCLLITACVTRKNNTTQTTSPPNPPYSLLYVTPRTGIYPPGRDELMAIQKQDSSITLQQLNAGYNIYSEGACIKCHAAQNIYKYDETKWANIIDNMAPMAQLSQTEKTAVYNYVLSVKAVQPPKALPLTK
jgi:hypothetical protein